jgi:hypothetical protein
MGHAPRSGKDVNADPSKAFTELFAKASMVRVYEADSSLLRMPSQAVLAQLAGQLLTREDFAVLGKEGVQLKLRREYVRWKVFYRQHLLPEYGYFDV